MIEVLTALPGVAWEGDVVARLERGTGVRVVRRCVDLADLLAVAAAGLGDAVLLSAELRRLDRDVLARLAAAGVAVLGLAPAADPLAADTLRSLGVRRIALAETSGTELAELLEQAVQALPEESPAGRGYSAPLQSVGPRRSVSDTVSGAVRDAVSDDRPPGSLVAVWGPTGAPGRTTVAVTLASEAARLGRSALIVDADTYGGVVAQCLGLLDESPGLAAATRLASTGSLDLPALARLAPEVEPRLRVLTGIPRADRWHELRPSALEEVYSRARELVSLVVVDCGFCVEQDEELTFDMAAPRRNGATLATLEQADTVVAVCSADAVGVQRFVRGLAELREAVPGAKVTVVVNRVRRAPVGAHPEQQLAEALERYAGVTGAVFVPEDRGALDNALLRGRTVADAAEGSGVRGPLVALAGELLGIAPSGRRGRVLRRGRVDGARRAG